MDRAKFQTFLSNSNVSFYVTQIVFNKMLRHISTISLDLYCFALSESITLFNATIGLSSSTSTHIYHHVYLRMFLLFQIYRHLHADKFPFKCIRLYDLGLPCILFLLSRFYLNKKNI